jgi:hypothetical protein
VNERLTSWRHSLIIQLQTSELSSPCVLDATSHRKTVTSQKTSHFITLSSHNATSSLKKDSVFGHKGLLVGPIWCILLFIGIIVAIVYGMTHESSKWIFGG